MAIFGFGTKTVAEATTAVNAAQEAVNKNTDNSKKIDLELALIDAKCELEKAQIDEKCSKQKEEAKSGTSANGMAQVPPGGGRRRKGGRHTKRHLKKSRKTSRRGRTGRKASRL